MKRRALALLLALALPLSGCAALLDHDYVDVQLHADQPSTEEDPSILRAEYYGDLVDGILYLVKQGMSHGVIRLSNYKGDAEADVEAACLEVVQEDPLGAYAVDYIKPECAYIVSYYEANITIGYRRTQEQVKNIASVTGSSAIRAELRDTLESFGTEAVLRVSYFNEDEAYIQSLIRQAYYNTPLTALGMPNIEVSIYPASEPDRAYAGGTQRIVEILLTYPEDQETLRKQKEVLGAMVERLAVSLAGLRGQAAFLEIFQLVQGACEYIPRGVRKSGDRLDTAYAALVGGGADSEGMALAFQIFCQRAGLESDVVAGTLEDEAHFWNVVALPGGEYRHVDTTREDGFALSDAALVEAGYLWNRDDTPACGAQPPEEGGNADGTTGEIGELETVEGLEPTPSPAEEGENTP